MIINGTPLRSNDPMTLHCGFCGAPMRACGCRRGAPPPGDRPGVIPLGPIDQGVLDDLRRIALAASMYDWLWSHSGTTTHEEAIEYFAQSVRHSDVADLDLVVFEDDGGESRTVAYTGNGPTSGANARFMCAAQPVNVIRLLDEIARLKRGI